MSDLSDETGIVWVDSADEFDYVRASTMLMVTPTGLPPKTRGVGECVGYAVLCDDTNPTAYSHTTPLWERRRFWLKPSDRDGDGWRTAFETDAPHRAVDPRTVEPGKPGELTERARRGRQ